MRSRNLLIIDDSPEDREIYKRLITKSFDCPRQFDEVETGGEGLSLCRVRRYECVLLDYRLPDMTGLEFLSDLYSWKNRHEVPVIMMTGQGNEHVAIDAMKLGAQDYILKCELSGKTIHRAVSNAVEKCQLQREIYIHNQNLEVAVEALTKKNEHISSFYHTVSHELKTPLTAAKEFSLIMLDGLAGPINEQQKEYLEIIRDSCDRMAVQINDLLDSSRLESNKIVLHPELSSLNKVVKRAVGELVPQAAAACLTLEYQEQGEDIVLEMDPVRIHQVIDNIINNSIKFTPAGGRIEVKVARNKSRHLAWVEIRDTGRGIPEDKLKNIFDHFYQEKEEDADIKGGLGLGLSISKSIVDLHRGTIDVTSRTGQGSTFIVTLPLCQQHHNKDLKYA